MAVSTKTIKRRLKSVKNTKKITKAMELVAAAKMRHAVEAAVNTRAYATLAWSLLTTLSRTETITLPLLEVREVKKILLILITSNRGLCGSFNSNIIRKTLRDLQANDNGVPVDIVAVGKKGADAARRAGRQLTGFMSDLPDTPRLTDVLPIARIVIDGYREKAYDKVFVAYTDYESALRQIPRLRQVLPVSKNDIERMIAETGTETGAAAVEDVLDEYLFEPNPMEVLELMLPRLVEMQIYQAVLESAASEHSARMLAMRSASDAAGDMIDELNLTYNKARQAGITQEIAEIAGGAAAL